MRTDILGVGFDSLSMDEALEKALSLMEEGRAAYVVTPNPEIVMLCRENEEAAAAVNGADLVLPDGIGVVYAAKLMRRPLRQKLPGIDFASGLMEKLAERGGSVYLFGAKPGVAASAGEKLSRRYPGLVVAGSHNGYFDDDGPIISDIAACAPDLLLVCLGAPKQELWMKEQTGKMPVGLMAGLGGSLDVFAGVTKRAPVFWQKLGLEWLYRLFREPKRIGRMMKLPRFLLLAIFSGKRT